MKRIIIHWTAGTYSPNSVELEHYHYLIGFEKLPSERGIIHTGKCKPEDNLCCTDGRREYRFNRRCNMRNVGFSRYKTYRKLPH